MTATIKRKLPKPPLPATKEYRYIEPMSLGGFNVYEWDPEKGKKARARSVEVRQKKAREHARENRMRTAPRRVWTPEEIADIERMRAQGLIWKDIARKYDVSDTAIMKAYKRAKKSEQAG